MSLEANLERVLARHDELQHLLATPNIEASAFANASRELAELSPVAEKVGELKRAQAELLDVEAMLDDPEMRAMAQEEQHRLAAVLPALEREVQLLLLPKDEADDKNAILEIRPGTGGDEASLFAADLFGMYQRYAAA